MSLVKVISGGQNGVDQAALRAAKSCGIATGGWAPRGWRTLDGPKPELKTFGLVEHSHPSYPPRTFKNVEDSHATLIVAANIDSPGEKCILRAIAFCDRPHFIVRTTDPEQPHKLAQRILDAMPRDGILNVAGNSELTCPGIGYAAELYLVELFKCIQELQR